MAVAAPNRPRPNTSRLFIIAGAFLAVIAFVLVLLLGARGGGAGGGGSTTKIVVAARAIPFRAPLSRDDLTLADWPSAYLPAGAFTSVDDVLGKQPSPAPSAGVNSNGAVAEIDIQQGQPVLSNMLAKSQDAVAVQPAFLPIPKGFVAITVPTSEQTGVAGYIQPGDYISIIATATTLVFSTGSGGSNQTPKVIERTVFTNVHVLKVGAATGQVGSSTSQPSSSGGVASSLTLVLTECDAEFLRWLQDNAKLTYTLPSYRDYNAQDIKPDPSCPEPGAAKGVGPGAVDSRWGFTKTT